MSNFVLMDTNGYSFIYQIFTLALCPELSLIQIIKSGTLVLKKLSRVGITFHGPISLPAKYNI